MSTIGWLYDENGTQGKTWNPVTGCYPVSPGCLNCYAASLASRGMCEDHRGLTRIKKRRNNKGKQVNRAVFNGEIHLHHERIEEPTRWKKGRRVFVNSMSDLFHKDVPFEFIAAIYKTMANCPQHTFLPLTKRPDRAREWYAWASSRIGSFFESGGTWPLPNVHLGVSAEDQRTLDERVPILLELPAAVRWVSAEPLLGPLYLRPYLPHEFNREPHCPWCEWCVGRGPRDSWTQQTDPDNHGPFLDWVVVGLESGPGARRGDLEWVDTIVKDCRGHDVPTFVKQLGSRPYRDNQPVILGNKKGDDPTEWSSSDRHLVVQELP